VYGLRKEHTGQEPILIHRSAKINVDISSAARHLMIHPDARVDGTVCCDAAWREPCVGD